MVLHFHSLQLFTGALLIEAGGSRHRHVLGASACGGRFWKVFLVDTAVVAGDRLPCGMGRGRGMAQSNAKSNLAL